MIYVVGIGPGNKKYILPLAEEIISKSNVAIGFKRAINSIDYIQVKKTIVDSMKDIISFINLNTQQDISILASGDPCFYGILNYIKKNYEYEIQVIPGISSFQYFMAKLGKSWNNAYVSSIHGRNKDFIKIIRENEVTVWLTDKQNSPNYICKELKQNSIEAKVYVGENLSYEDEKIRIGSVDTILSMVFNELCVVVVEKH
ncbi:cobalt-precorrin-7 (C5)-methyltransferase [Clostridium acetobutylicum]|uniref:Precorrin-6B methylase 1 CobL1/CbiE n=1 Tax=Clostridium acetobutylicum (strain ATCC 824 / DSM 792 / JCM 1419 / IAM 19013 / LMG 5710 / NBRC 13948 / NRRL B-527 / VKM B-1787 / 2291 / W) TaxID=272562 RepID=Q97LH7_CLOAB|nr:MULTISPECIES: precorrin-6y C5,15-methyltransferase (decarboxylating) subunit CbiE [Clostridium]AAK78562.1 Precorrin-6B methylase 1 CobL1/CbiE [Clostridium acetobutylicum ATCC 824]ADZ19636.1 Precorrin-6B methylase 1 CobL1/CbiE [Clostridium acetobutylicum EA 2018]AEI34165.1 precorrin-6B methylase 1 CobL1/CbiE [Clostridium acetobutylicum DSM 1731]AWV80286.1 precorrin-6y C5,15-methyltransferase (decarboxylating) subunit CbiE [Clostridium acetobutylicum]MBC2392471.1 precorrin-6y C5,15-methyltran